jgi:predicted HicB family RNase H-like nuclease
MRLMKKAAKRKPVTIRIEADAHQQLKVSAAQLGISIKSLVSRLAAQRQ